MLRCYIDDIVVDINELERDLHRDVEALRRLRSANRVEVVFCVSYPKEDRLLIKIWNLDRKESVDSWATVRFVV